MAEAGDTDPTSLARRLNLTIPSRPFGPGPLVPGQPRSVGGGLHGTGWYFDNPCDHLARACWLRCDPGMPSSQHRDAWSGNGRCHRRDCGRANRPSRCHRRRDRGNWRCGNLPSNSLSRPLAILLLKAPQPVPILKVDLIRNFLSSRVHHCRR
jgi:hypothetical protein